MFSGRGQPGCEQLIDRYRIACRPVRDVLVDYLRERQPSVDFSTLQHCRLPARQAVLGRPGGPPPRHRLAAAAPRGRRGLEAAGDDPHPHHHRPRRRADHADRQPRLDGRSVLTAVRAFYLDLAEWADDDPARWAPWAVRCPVTASDVSHKKDRSHRKSRMDQRTRERLPVLPALVAWVDAERARTAERARRRRDHPARRAVHRRRGDAAPHGDEDRRPPAGSGPKTPTAANGVT